jgi:hypothetical protein
MRFLRSRSRLRDGVVTGLVQHLHLHEVNTHIAPPTFELCPFLADHP